MTTRTTGLYALLILSMLLFGGSWVTGKLLADRAAPEPLIFWRFSISALLMVPVLFLPDGGERQRVHKPTKEAKESESSGKPKAPSLFLSALIGSVFLALYNVCFFLGLERGYASVGGVLVTTLNPIVTFAMSTAVFRQKPLRIQVLGIACGLAGGAVILEVWSLTATVLVLSGNIFFLLASLCYSSLTVWSQRAGGSYLRYSALVYALTAVLSLPLLAVRGLGTFDVPMADPVFWLSLAFLSAGTTSIGTTIYFLAARRIGSSRTASFIFTIPLSALLLSWLILGEVPELATVLGGVISIAAVFLVNAKKTAS